jgi:hypothetical protein
MQSAVSRQVQALEELLGVKLLTRGHRSTAFTPEGERLFQTMSYSCWGTFGATRLGHIAGPGIYAGFRAEYSSSRTFLERHRRRGQLCVPVKLVGLV